MLNEHEGALTARRASFRACISSPSSSILVRDSGRRSSLSVCAEDPGVSQDASRGEIQMTVHGDELSGPNGIGKGRIRGRNGVNHLFKYGKTSIFKSCLADGHSCHSCVLIGLENAQIRSSDKVRGSYQGSTCFEFT